MKITGGAIYALQIPFVEAFSHSAKSRAFSDAIVLRLTGEDGTVGYGEGVARPYVTGETVESCCEHMAGRLWPAVCGVDYPELVPGSDPVAALAPVDDSLPDGEAAGVVAWHAARTAFELALVDLLLKRQALSLAAILPPGRMTVTYSGIVSTGSVERAAAQAGQIAAFGLRQVKVKIGGAGDRERVAAIRQVVGPSVSLRVDANGAYDAPRAVAVLSDLAEFGIDCAEQPVPRGDPGALAGVRSASPVPVMADESLVTCADARALIAAEACDFFNLRLSKCGGIGRTLEMAGMAARAGLKIQLGCQVGETAILSAAGRHVAAFLKEVAFVEGSYGGLLLSEDVAEEEVTFGRGGEAPVLQGPGLGIRVCEEILRRYARSVTTLGEG